MNLLGKNINYSKKEIFLNIYFVVFCIGVLRIFINQISRRYEWAWNASEWLINYQGGFVRRGLRGEIIYQLYTRFNFDPYTTICLITACALILLFVFFVKQFVDKGFSLFILPCVFVMGNPILNNFWLRTDCILCLLFIGIVFLIYKKTFLYKIWINLLFIVGLLFHEIFLFVFGPIVVVLFMVHKLELGQKNIFKNFILATITLFPSLLCFIFIVLNNGSREIMQIVWASWGENPFSIDFSDVYYRGYPGALSALDANFKEGLRMASEGLFFFSNNLYTPIMVILSVMAIFCVLINIKCFNFRILGFKPNILYNIELLICILVFQFIITLPLYIIGYDYGRWIFLWVISSFIVIFIIPEKRLLHFIPDSVLRIASKIVKAFTPLKSITVLLSCLICFSVTLWFFYDVQTSSIYTVLASISSLVKTIFL